MIGGTGTGPLVWTGVLDDTALWQAQLRGVLATGINVFLLFFGVLGLGVGVWNFATLARDGGQLGDFWTATGRPFLVFWLSVGLDLYGYFRLRDAAAIRHVLPRLDPSADAPEFTAALGDPARWVRAEQFLSPSARRVLERSWRFARRFGHATLEPIHLFASLLQEPSILGMVARLGIAGNRLTDGLSRLLGAVARAPGQPPVLAATTRRLLLTAAVEASARGRAAVGSAELFAAYAHVPEPVADLLDALGVDAETLENVVEWLAINETLVRQTHHLAARATLKPKGAMNRAMTAVATPRLDRIGRDLTALARVGSLPYCVNRESEIDATFRALEGGRRSVILVGSPGVGKTAILYGIAERMAAEEVPRVLQDKRLVQLSVPALVGGGAGAGDLEAGLLSILTEVQRAGNIVLAIENLHTLIGVTSSGGGLDLSEVLGQTIQRGGLTVIGTTTPESFRRYVEESGSLLSAFERVEVEEPDPTATLHILQAKVGPLEAKTGLVFAYDALTRTVELSRRYLHERFLPEKAVNLLEEVAIYVGRSKGGRRTVTGEDVAEIVSARAKVRVTAISEDESEKLLHLEERMHQRMVGQDEAVTAVAGALRRARAGLRDEKRPIASFLFLGPTGVGKTELAKTVAEVYFGDENAMVRLDMSEYQDAASLRRLLGAPPGTGTEHGFLTEAVRARPFTLVLLDEVEKSHPDILNVFLQVMDDGRLTDNLGRTVDFTNVIIIATSNAGTPLIQERLTEGVALSEIKEELVRSALAQYFRPELLNRFDGIILFKPLTGDEIEKIVGLMLGRIAADLEKRGIRFTASSESIRNLAAQGFDPLFGARPLRRLISETVDNALARYLLTGHLGRRDVAVLEPDGTIRVEAATAI
jgi:ATP-dependent Clp protease ATP-binding subunit ClpC